MTSRPLAYLDQRYRVIAARSRREDAGPRFAFGWNYSRPLDEKFLIRAANDQSQQTIINKTPHFGVSNRGNNLARLGIKQILAMHF
jgi:hypothetical protein